MSTNPFGPYRTPNLGLYLPTVRTNVLDTVIQGGKMAIVYNYETIDQAIAQLQQTGGGVLPATKALYVDGGRTDSYTETGSVLNPFKTIMGAINQVIQNGDNSPTLIYKIDIVGPGVYQETIDLGNAAIVSLYLRGTGGVIVEAPSGANALQSLANNNGFVGGQIEGIEFSGPVRLVNPTNNGNFASSELDFVDCTFQGLFLLQNAQNVGFYYCDFSGYGGNYLTQFINVNNAFYFNSIGHSSGTLQLASSSTYPQPAGFGGSYLLGQGSPLNFGTITLSDEGLGTEMDIDIGSLLGKTGGAVGINGGSLLRLFPGACISSNVTVDAASAFTILGGALRGSLTVAPGGTFTLEAELFTAKVLASTFAVGTNPDQTNPIIVGGAGDPNGVVDAPSGSQYLRTDGGAGTSLYVKETASGNSGWAAK